MSGKRKVIQNSGPRVPGYIVTFSDMVTLLLTFFVMLLGLAESQDPELVNKGRDSFVESIRSFGLGILQGRRKVLDLDEVKLKYSISNPDEQYEGRTIDAKEEETRRLFKKSKRLMATLPSQIVAQRTNFSVTNIRFAPGDASLNESAKGFLRKFCSDLQQASDSEGIGLYVLGLAGDEATEKEQWILSARRAQVVADFLQKMLSSEPRRPVYCWGAGPGGDWISRDSPVSRQSQILIAVLRVNG